MNTEPTTVQWVCVCCTYWHHYAEACECCNPDDLMKLFGDIEVTAGMFREEHEEGCSPEEDCDCETNPFSWSPCDGCGSNLGGERNAMTGWLPKSE